MSYPAQLGLTLLVELGLLALVVPGGRSLTLLGTGLGVNLVTHPVAHALYNATGELTAIEIGVLLCELVGYRLVAGLGWGTAALAAGLTNGATWGLSLLL